MPSTLMKSKITSTHRTFRSNLICRICGDLARGMNFDVLTCMSCKSFFRRNALRSSGIRRCGRKNYCSIKKETRAGCPSCRLRKCYVFGMNPLLIQSGIQYDTNSSTFQQLIATNQSQIQLPTPKPLGLLQNDRSTLTTDQWNLLSNIIRSYDEQDLINRMKNLLHAKSSLPPKLRLKPADTFNLLNQSMTFIQPRNEHSPQFHYLSNNARETLILHNVYHTSCINGLFIVRETDAFRNEMFMTATSALFGYDFVKNCVRDSERLEQNGSLIKIMLFVLIFSSNYSIVVFNDQEDIETISGSTELVYIQDIYVTMLWKYLVYLYGYDQAAIRFSSLIKYVIDLLRRVDEVSKSLAHHILLDRIVTQTKQSLSIED